MFINLNFRLFLSFDKCFVNSVESLKEIMGNGNSKQHRKKLVEFNASKLVVVGDDAVGKTR
jgi:hypothetical protein